MSTPSINEHAKKDQDNENLKTSPTDTHKRRPTVVLNPTHLPHDSMSSVHDNYSKLNLLVGILDSKLDGVLARHEKDFLSAYRAHMYKVQRELQILKDRANVADSNLKRDNKINSLEAQLEWFREEAIRLGEASTTQQKEIDKWRTKAETLEEDRKFFEQQVKAAKRQNKLLKAALSKSKLDILPNISGLNDEVDWNNDHKKHWSPKIKKRVNIQLQRIMEEYGNINSEAFISSID